MIDGGFSKNQIQVEDSEHATLTVSPFSGDADICPSSKRHNSFEFMRVYFAEQGTDITLDNISRLLNVLAPPPPHVMAEILMQGYHDATDFLTRHGKIDVSCTTCLTVKSKYTPTDVLKVNVLNGTLK